jgi:hypothetical protein
MRRCLFFSNTPRVTAVLYASDCSSSKERLHFGLSAHCTQAISELQPTLTQAAAPLRLPAVVLACLQTRRAMPCPQGTYKASLSNTAGCIRCPAGSTTRALRSTTPADRVVALPRYQVIAADPSTAPDGLSIQPCPKGTFSTG